MDLTSKKVIKELLRKHKAAPLKRLGQHFLIDKGVLKKIIEAAELRPKDIVLEIGPGIGTLTQELAQKARKVIAVEKDKKMAEILLETLKDSRNVEIIQADILKIENCPDFVEDSRQGRRKLKIGNFKLVANLPYYIVSPVIRKFLESGNSPEETELTEVRPRSIPQQMVLMVQKEVAQRICASPKMNLLAVSVQFYAQPKIISYVSKKSFWPSPKVDSAIIKIIPLINTNRKLIDTKLFFQLVKTGFSHPRKQLINNLSTGLKIGRAEVKKWLLKNEVQPTRRAETLTIESWINLTKSFQKG